MMKLLDTDGAWIAIAVTLVSIIAGVVMKRLFVKVLKNSERAAADPTETPKND